MPLDLFSVIQTFSILLAAGTPGLTYYVMMKVHATQLSTFKEQCTICRKDLDSHLDCITDDLNSVTGRQKILREEILPDKYVTTHICSRSHDACKEERKKAEDAIWSRINQVVDKVKGGGS